MDGNPLALLIGLHADNERQGPGSRSSTLTAIELAGLDRTRPLQIADLGCGTGASALLLADILNAKVTAVDLSGEFLARLDQRAEAMGLGERIETRERTIDDLPFEDGRFDVIWSEGAIYNVGFERGVNAWRRFLKPRGVLVASEITWTTDARPDVIEAFWTTAYPEIDTASAKMAVLEGAGFSPIGYFPLGPECWMDEYYGPLEAGFEAFLERHAHSAQARAIVESEREEIELYRRYGEYYSYGVYVARRIEPSERQGS